MIDKLKLLKDSLAECQRQIDIISEDNNNPPELSQLSAHISGTFMELGDIEMDLNEDTKFILGRPNFWCGSIAPLLRESGYEIPKKAEDEQAYVIHWMLSIYEKHGESWKEKINTYLNEAATLDKKINRKHNV